MRYDNSYINRNKISKSINFFSYDKNIYILPLSSKHKKITFFLNKNYSHIVDIKLTYSNVYILFFTKKLNYIFINST